MEKPEQDAASANEASMFPEEPFFEVENLRIQTIGWSALATFAIAWLYCMDQYGFLVGFGFGWIPSLMLAAIVGFAAYYLWWLILIFLGIGFVAMFIR